MTDKKSTPPPSFQYKEEDFPPLVAPKEMVVLPPALGITEEFDYDEKYETEDFEEEDDDTSLSSSSSPPSKPPPLSSPPPPTSFAPWIEAKKKNKKHRRTNNKRKRKNSPSSNSSSSLTERPNRHRASSKIVVGSRVAKRIGEPLEHDLTPTGNKRRAYVKGTVLESLGRQTWKIKFDNDVERTYHSSQLKFEHNDYVHQNVLKTKVSIVIIYFMIYYDTNDHTNKNTTLFCCFFISCCCSYGDTIFIII